MDCFLTGCPVNYKGSSGAAIGNPFREIGGEIWHRAKWFRNNEHTDRMDNTGGKKYECRNNYEADKCKDPFQQESSQVSSLFKKYIIPKDRRGNYNRSYRDQAR